MTEKLSLSNLILDLPNEQASQDFAKELALRLKAPLILGLSGSIGTGKTTFVRALFRAMGIKPPIKSPSFSIVESYESSKGQVHHFDLYRIHHEEELEYIGFREYFTKNGICCIEWPEHAQNSLPYEDIRFNLIIKGSGREMQITAFTKTGSTILACWTGES